MRAMCRGHVANIHRTGGRRGFFHRLRLPSGVGSTRRWRARDDEAMKVRDFPMAPIRVEGAPNTDRTRGGQPIEFSHFIRHDLAGMHIQVCVSNADRSVWTLIDSFRDLPEAKERLEALLKHD